jgi:hypothetical protein
VNADETLEEISQIENYYSQLPLVGTIFDNPNSDVIFQKMDDLIDHYQDIHYFYAVRPLNTENTGNVISSAGLRVLLMAVKRAGQVTVINASEAVKDIFETTGFDQMIQLR